MTDYILGLDPGKTTGVAVCEFKVLTKTEWPTLVTVGQIELWYGLDDILEKWKPKGVAAESYKLYPFKAKSQAFSDMPSAQVIGVLTYLCNKMGIPLLLQGAHLIADLKVIPVKIRTEHERDAFRHCTHYLRYMKRNK
jgi:hypothetical protein